MLRSAVIAVLLGLAAFFSSCHNKAVSKDYAKEGYVKAKVIKYEVESCGYLLELADENKTKLEPGKLPDDLLKHGQPVWVKYTPVKKQMMSTCMAGTQVEVIDILKR